MMNTQNKNIKQCWIGLAHVRPKEGNDLLEGAIGAFVQTLALTGRMGDFVSMVTKRLEAYDFEVVEIEDIEPFSDRLNNSASNPAVDDDISVLAEGLSDEDPIALATFEAYMADE